ncbi:MAG: competence/damage-inducible protein A [Betaproteobacteria bacterium]|nr:competence/damage-inducible protein A [Betaproteobacteria bacterium]
MNFGLLIVGDEILSGRRQDKHLSKVIELLNARGLTLEYCEYVGDDPVRITASLRRAFASGDAVFSTGGIGATPDDHTRQCAAAALGVPLALHPEAKALILQRMQDIAREQGVPYEPDREDNVHRLNMGVFPQGAQIIPNPYNKIPGFSCWAPAGGSEAAERGGMLRSGAGPSQAASAPSGGSEASERGGIHFVPGFPVMAWPMIEWVLDTYYAPCFHRSARVERSVIVYGAMEATLTPLMEQIEARFAPVKVFSLPSVDHPEHGRHIDLGVKGTADLSLAAFGALKDGLAQLGARLGPEMVR